MCQCVCESAEFFAILCLIPSFLQKCPSFPQFKRKSVIGNEKYFQTFVLVRVQTILVWVFWVTAIRISVSYEIELSVAELKRVRIIHAPCKNDRGRPICQMDFFWNLKTNLKSIATAQQSPPLFLLVTKSLYSPLYQYSTYVHTENPKWVGVNFNKKYWVVIFLKPFGLI